MKSHFHRSDGFDACSQWCAGTGWPKVSAVIRSSPLPPNWAAMPARTRTSVWGLKEKTRCPRSRPGGLFGGRKVGLLPLVGDLTRPQAEQSRAVDVRRVHGRHLESRAPGLGFRLIPPADVDGTGREPF